MRSIFDLSSRQKNLSEKGNQSRKAFFSKGGKCIEEHFVSIGALMKDNVKHMNTEIFIESQIPLTNLPKILVLYCNVAEKKPLSNNMA